MTPTNEQIENILGEDAFSIGAFEMPDGKFRFGFTPYELEKKRDAIICLLETAKQAGIREERERIKSRVGFLRQWLNEKPEEVIETNDILHWLEIEAIDNEIGNV